MNPAEDTICFGDEITEGMLVIVEAEALRSASRGENEFLRANRFCKVTRLRRFPPFADYPTQIQFVGEWIDGYQRVMRYATDYAWIVKRGSLLRPPQAPEVTGP
jgi:hypothetical protein